MARHALYDGTCKVAVEYRCNEYNMEDNAQHKQLGDIIVGGRVSHYRPRYVVWSCLATTESLFGIVHRLMIKSLNGYIRHFSLAFMERILQTMLE